MVHYSHIYPGLIKNRGASWHVKTLVCDRQSDTHQTSSEHPIGVIVFSCALVAGTLVYPSEEDGLFAWILPEVINI